MSQAKVQIHPVLSSITEDFEPEIENEKSKSRKSSVREIGEEFSQENVSKIKVSIQEDKPSKTTTFTDDTQERKQIRFSVVDTAKIENEIGTIAAGMRLEYKKTPKTCEHFMNVEDFSALLVDGLIDESLTRGKIIQNETSSRVIEGIECQIKDEDESLSTIESIGTYVCVFEWPTIEEFTVEIGINKINEYFSYWKFEEDWKYCVNYLKGESDEACDFHRYEIIFSIPCKQYPIPQATASIYFTYEISRVRPKHCLVDVYYCFEGHRLMHTPGRFKLQEDWLFQIVDAKIKFFKTLTF